MTRILFFCLFSVVVSNQGTAQLDAMIHKYWFNALNYNPAYTGINDNFEGNLTYRHDNLAMG